MKIRNYLTLIKRLIKYFIRNSYWYAEYSFIRLLRHLRGDHQGLVYINPLMVTHTVNRHDRTLKTDKMWHFGTVLPGDWDLNGFPVRDYGCVYIILKKRFLDGLEFDDIPEFKANLERIRRGETPDNCNTEEKYRNKYHKFEKLFFSIKHQGYRTQKELKSINLANEVWKYKRPDEIRVQVGRKGNMLFEEGMHRLVIAQMLELNSIPVIITRCHQDWFTKTGSRLPKQI